MERNVMRTSTSPTSPPPTDRPVLEGSEKLSSAALSNRPHELSGRPVLLATDGSPTARQATLLAAALAAQYHARIHVLNVVDTSPAPIPPPLDLALGVADAVAGEALHERQVKELRQTISELTAEGSEWPVHVKLGIPAHAIVREATRLGADLIILGLRRHGKLDRALNDETVLSVMRSAACPVIGVAADLTGLPKRIVAALDFSVASLEAVRAARMIADAQSSLVLTYVPPLMAYLPGDGESVVHDLGVQAGFDRTSAELARPGLRVEHIVLPHELSHPVPKLLLEYADDTKADLIAAGSGRHSRVDRWMIGSVSTDLVRDGRRSVLIVPPRPAR